MLESTGPRHARSTGHTHIALLHGVVDDWSAVRHTDFNFVSADSFVSHLKSVPRYGPWPEFASRRVLTVDDATRAAGYACEIAASLGHHPILFINPEDVIEQTVSALALLDTLLDCQDVRSVDWEGTHFDLSSFWGTRRFRRLIKGTVRRLPRLEALDYVEQLARTLRKPDLKAPEHLYPLHPTALRRLCRIGVQIENHGWSHVDISSMESTEFVRHYADAARWLDQELSIISRLYAAPFGNYAPLLSSCPVPVMLADRDLPLGPVSANIWNRKDITDTLSRRSYPGAP